MPEKQKHDVLEANDNFYHAVKSGDIGLMDNVWIKDASVKCVHPGWPMLYGLSLIHI